MGKELVEKEKVEGFTYKNYFKNENDIDELINGVITDVDVHLDIANMDSTKLISQYFV